MSISPNPFQNTINIYSPLAISNAVINVTDMNGVLLSTYHKNIAAGDKVLIDASHLSKGMYLVTIQSQTDKQVFKIVK